MGIKKLWVITYVDPMMGFDGLADALVEGYDEDDALETFSMIYDGAFEIVAVEEDVEDDTIYEDYSDNMFCDNSGYCAGTSCPQYWKCH